jgi:DNA-directed RNA polymerase subunit RPC12/RpoP
MSSSPILGTSQTEVRRCAKCQQTAVVLVFEWKHSYNGVESGTSTRDYRCQACGARFSLYPRVSSITFIVIGLVMSCAIFPLGFTLLGWLRLRRDGQNPVVPDAPRPAMKYRDGPPVRRCGRCREEATLASVTRHKHNGVPTGTEYEYLCAKCNKPFVVESLWGHCFAVLSGSVIAGIGVAFLLIAESPWWRYGGGGVALLLAVFAYGQTAIRAANRVRNPVVEGLVR